MGGWEGSSGMWACCKYQTTAVCQEGGETHKLLPSVRSIWSDKDKINRAKSENKEWALVFNILFREFWISVRYILWHAESNGFSTTFGVGFEQGNNARSPTITWDGFSDHQVKLIVYTLYRWALRVEMGGPNWNDKYEFMQTLAIYL